MRARWVWTVVGVGLLMGATLVWAQTVNRRTDVYSFVNGLRTSMIATLDGLTTASMTSVGLRVTPPATQVIAAGGTVAADACGGFKAISAAGAVTTSTTNTFTAPAAANAGCFMHVCNVGATNNITLDTNAAFLSIGGADIVMTPNDCTAVVSDGVVWRSSGSLVAN